VDTGWLTQQAAIGPLRGAETGPIQWPIILAIRTERLSDTMLTWDIGAAVEIRRRPAQYTST